MTVFPSSPMKVLKHATFLASAMSPYTANIAFSKSVNQCSISTAMWDSNGFRMSDSTPDTMLSWSFGGVIGWSRNKRVVSFEHKNL